MSDASSIRKTSTLSLESQRGAGFYESAVRFYGNQAYINTGAQWLPVGNVVTTTTIPVVADDVSQDIFIADRPYQINSITEVHTVASGNTTATGTAVLGFGVNTITVTNPGDSYTIAPDVAITPHSGDTTGSGATATATIFTTGPNTGQINTITVTAPGSLYTAAPDVTITPHSGDSTGELGTATSALLTIGAVAKITLGSGGTQYTSAPTVTVAAPTSGTTALATATLSGNSVNAFVVGTHGSGYTTAPSVTVSGGNGAITVNKCTGTQIPSAGSSVLSGSINPNATAGTIQTGSVVSTGVSQLAAGDRLALVITGTGGSLAGSVITTVLSPL